MYEIDLQEFIQDYEKGLISEIIVIGSKIYGRRVATRGFDEGIVWTQSI